MRSAAHAPNPPARITAIEDDGGQAPAIGARRIGKRSPNRSQNAAARLRGSPIKDVDIFSVLRKIAIDWRRARRELEPFLKEQPENFVIIGDLALINAGLNDKAAALDLA
jgi:hypothetical protein